MSRCLPYTPLNCKKEDGFPVGSIKKLQNGRGNIKQRKEPSEKPSKKRSRDECGNLDSSEHKSKKRREAEKKTKPPNGSCGDPRKDHCEHLERSDLSEEHNPPAAFVPNHSSSSLPNTPKSSKKIDVQAADLNGKRPSMVLRIKLPLKKHNDPQPLSTCKVPLCSSAQMSTPSKSQMVIVESTTQPKPQFPVSEVPCFSGRAAEDPAGIMVPEPSKPRHQRSHGHRIRKSERRFRQLMLNWKPPPLQLSDEEDLDWLFASRRPPKEMKSSERISKAPAPEPSACRVPTDSLQPRACYLPEFDMYQLPYVIPF
ncbi:hypothetical protein KSP40_PGU012998 [Platanthera guangdongensis]|uniref:Uncharacterized protein n=1 Tax=Platanthera guangdongensis TaxID=2320717 RepID=A0ABR2LN33_9ASPA